MDLVSTIALGVLFGNIITIGLGVIAGLVCGVIGHGL